MLKLVFTRLFIWAGVSVLFPGFLLASLWNDGPLSVRWESFRKFMSLKADIVDSRAGPRSMRDEEFVTKTDKDLETVEEKLRNNGFARNILSRLKTSEGVPESSSWVLRDSVFSHRQLHIMLFEKEEGVDVFAHEELSSINPWVAVQHFNGVTQDPEKGVEMAEEMLLSDRF